MKKQKTAMKFCVEWSNFHVIIFFLEHDSYVFFVFIIFYDFYDMISYDMILYDMISYDMIPYDMRSYDIISYDMIPHDMISYDMISYDMISAADAAAETCETNGKPTLVSGFLTLKNDIWNNT